MRRYCLSAGRWHSAQVELTASVMAGTVDVSETPENPNWTPAFPGQRPPFQKGNLARLSHGGYVAALVNPRAREIASALAETLPHYLTTDPAYAPALEAYSVVLARIERVSAWLEQQAADGIPEIDGDGRVRGAMDLLLRLERQAADHRTRLGLDPLSRARLGRDVASQQESLAQAMSAWADREQQGESR
jgi:hypothetical protein